MQKVLAGLNPDGHPPFVSVYLDDILIFSETFEGHFSQLQVIITRLSDAGLSSNHQNVISFSRRWSTLDT